MLQQVIALLLCLSIAVNAEITSKDIDTVKRALTAAIQLNNRCKTSADCTTVATGSRGCGGPTGYVAYSTKSSNADDILSLAQLITKLEAQHNQDNSAISICAMEMPLKGKCNQTKKCVATSAFSPIRPGRGQ